MIRALKPPALAAFLVAVALAAFLGGWQLARAFVWDSNSNTHNSCYYSGYTAYGVPLEAYAYSQSFHEYCASWIYLSVYTWNSAISDFDEFLSGWVIGSFDTVIIEHYDYPTTNVYGYHQIRKPVSSDSPTIETHAQ